MTNFNQLNNGSGNTPSSISHNKIEPLSQNNLYMPPKCTESEQIFIGSILNTGSLWAEYQFNTKAETFYDSKHQEIIRAFHNMAQHDTPIDLLTLREYFEKKGDEYQAGSSSYWTYLMQIADGSYLPNLEHHHCEINKAFYGRMVRDICLRVVRDLEISDYISVNSNLDKLYNLQFEGPIKDNRLQPISAKDLPDIEPPESIWAGLLYPGTITTITAEPGIGKTTLGYNIGCHGAFSSPFLGFHFSKPIKTLYVDVETPLWLRKHKIESIIDECPTDFHLLENLDLRSNIVELIQICMKEKYDLIVFDTQSKVLALEDENSNSEANQAASLLRQLVIQTDASLLLIHHTKKGIGGRNVYKGRGASAIAAAVDIVAYLESGDSDTLKLTVAKSRVPGTVQSITMKKLGDDKFELVSTDAVNELEKLRKVINEFNLKGLKVNQKAIVEHFNGKFGEKHIRSLLKQGEGELWKVERGERKENVYTAICSGN